jgi:hypothetical protein
VPSHRVYRLMATAALAIGLILAGGVPASAVGGTSTGPVQINPLGHPGLCWQASGSGDPILLERCDPTAETQKWTLTSDGVMTNGIGYCLEAGAGEPDGTPLYIDFADQCYGQTGQVWRYGDQTGQLTSVGACASLSGPPSTGTEIVRGACIRTASRGIRWSIGYSAVTLAANGTASARAGATFSAPVTIANAASAQTAYGVTVSFSLPPRLSVTGLAGVGDAAGLLCDAQALTCTGTLRPGASGHIVVSGRVSARARGSQPVSARVTVAGTSQLPGMAGTSAAFTIAVRAAPAVPTTAGAPQGMLLYVLVAVALILLVVILLFGLTRRGWRLIDKRAQRRQPAHRAPPVRSTVTSRRLYVLLIAKRADLDLNGERFGQADHLARLSRGVLDIGRSHQAQHRNAEIRVRIDQPVPLDARPGVIGHLGDMVFGGAIGGDNLDHDEHAAGQVLVSRLHVGCESRSVDHGDVWDAAVPLPVRDRHPGVITLTLTPACAAAVRSAVLALSMMISWLRSCQGELRIHPSRIS